MPIKIKTDLKKLKNYNKEVKDRYQDELNSGAAGYELIRLLQDIIKKGISPVDGEGRFEKYSESYREAIRRGDYPSKKVSPVNMYLSGDMLGSLRFKKVAGKLYVEFGDKKAAYHQYGQGNMPKRKLLPTGLFDKFNKRISSVL